MEARKVQGSSVCAELGEPRAGRQGDLGPLTPPTGGSHFLSCKTKVLDVRLFWGRP